MTRCFALDLASAEKFVLVVLSEYAKDDGTGCYPAVSTIARKTSLTVRSVQILLKRLTEGGFIVNVGISKLKTTEYKLTLDRGNHAVIKELRIRRTEKCRSKKKPETPEPGSQPGAGLPTNQVPKRGEPGNGLPPNQDAKNGRTQFTRSKDLAKNLIKNRSGAQTSPRSSPEHLTASQKRWRDIRKLADAALSIWAGNHTMPGWGRTDLAEDLKRYAAQNGIQYFDGLKGANGIIEQAIIQSEKRRPL